MSLLKDIKKTRAYKEARDMHELLAETKGTPSNYLHFVHVYATKMKGVIRTSLGKIGANVESLEWDAEVGSIFMEFRALNLESRVDACSEMLEIDFPRVHLGGFGEYTIEMHPSEILADIEELYRGVDAKCESALKVLADAAASRKTEATSNS